ncbi:hypothetical protein KFK09_028597 [Dendrobium nobile]|uniref:Uncharacterized protein n=1 Tax=Dendrobium nobile TaxID=94219 RepID=A0A8T3A2X9_DENNO|nr:hypothetical protein KFK09_028597 [Dendrobium nobile]
MKLERLLERSYGKYLYISHKAFWKRIRELFYDSDMSLHMDLNGILLPIG